MATTDDLQLFYIFGHNISHSLSPALHNSGFEEIGFPGHYSIHESPEVDETVEAIINQPNFGGASVTFPHKLQVGRFVKDVTPAATAVGAINTLVVKSAPGGDDKILIGDNTDWSGIKTCILDAWETDMNASPALVWGAGGAARAACYALQTLGFSEVLLVNRSEESGKKLAAHFPELDIRIFSTLHDANATAKAPVRVIVCCIPADDVTESHIPETLFSTVRSGVLIEMAYRPPVTAMMKAAAKNSAWSIFDGMDVLKHQAFAQFELWTGHVAPTEIMSAAMRNVIEGRQKTSLI